MERILTYLVEEPGRVTSIGRLIVRVSCVLLVAAASGNFATKATNIALSIGGKLEQQRTLSDVYPGFPLWWVPESTVAVVASILGIGVGYIIFLSGRKIDHQHS
jgi:hypothetical protein